MDPYLPAIVVASDLVSFPVSPGAMNRLSTASYGGMDAETIKIEHVFTFNINEKWEKPLRQALGSWLDISWQWAKSFEIIGYGIATYLVCAGAARLVDSIKGKGKGGGADGFRRGDDYRHTLDMV